TVPRNRRSILGRRWNPELQRTGSSGTARTLRQSGLGLPCPCPINAFLPLWSHSTSRSLRECRGKPGSADLDQSSPLAKTATARTATDGVSCLTHPLDPYSLNRQGLTPIRGFFFVNNEAVVQSHLTRVGHKDSFEPTDP